MFSRVRVSVLPLTLDTIHRFSLQSVLSEGTPASVSLIIPTLTIVCISEVEAAQCLFNGVPY
jgi:hypothetical protein